MVYIINKGMIHSCHAFMFNKQVFLMTI